MTVPDQFSALVKHTRKPRPLAELCDLLDLSPRKVRALVLKAQEAGLAIKLGADSIGLGHHQPTGTQDLAIKPTVGRVQRVAVASDLHLGSKYCMRAQLKDFIKRAYRLGVREVLMPGDLLDGCYPHGQFELDYSGIEDQALDLYRVLPCLPGMTYHAITGNHDETFTKPTGLNIGRYISGVFKDLGRNDLYFYGDRAATLRVRGTTIQMWHPMGSCSYAVSYKLQKRVEAYSSAEKPGILLVGHYHKSCYLFTRGVHAIACPTFQAGGSAFGNALGGGAPATGGLILEWQLTKDRTLRDFAIRPISYFVEEREKELKGK